MAISFIGSTNGAFANAIGGDFTLPAGFQAGDLGVFWWFTRDSARTFTKPASLNEKMTDSLLNFGKIWVGYRYLQGGDTTFGWTCSSSSNETIVWGASVFRGTVTAGDPFEAQSGAASDHIGNSGDITPPSVSVVSAGACVFLVNGKDETSTVNAYPSGYATAGGTSSTLGTDASIWTCYRVVASAGTESPGVWDFNSPGGEENLCWGGSIAPAAAVAAFVPRVMVF